MITIKNLIYLLVWFSIVGFTQADDIKFFRDNVEPILKKNCYECHSHISGVMEGDLTLDWRSGLVTGGSRGPAIVPGKPERSLIIKAVRHSDPELQMPEDKLSDKDIAILTQWVKSGAIDPRTKKPASTKKNESEWWSLKPLVRPEIPENKIGNPIDSFIRARLKKEGIKASIKADRRTLIRRLTYDLHGLIPTIEDTNAFIADKSVNAYKKLVDRLLESPRYGERWARHWLDTVHYADSHGYEHDVFRPNAWRFRDYVIDRLNQDIPWSKFIKEQLAADFFFPKSPEITVALGFLGAGPYDQSKAATAPKSFEYLDRDDLVTQVMGAFVSTTANCARCHAHKFDPITQSDYFALQAVFAGIGKGEISFDNDKSVASKRSYLKNIKAEAKSKKPVILLTPENLTLLSKWEKARQSKPLWVPMKIDKFTSTEETKLEQQADGSILSTGKRPDKDTITITASSSLSKITSIRLDVLTDDSLPLNGPGRMDNGNLHLSEFEIREFKTDSKKGKIVPIRQATADFNQNGWTIQHAIDGNPKTAWGIHPDIGVSHHAVFELKNPLKIEPGTRLTITLKQLHGSGHVIGRFNLSATDAPNNSAIALSEEAEKTLGIPVADRTREQQALLMSVILQYQTEVELQKLPPLFKVYAAGSVAENDRGMIKISKPREIRLLVRGDIDKPRAVIEPGALTATKMLTARFKLSSAHHESARRAALANWLSDPRNPLTWRSIANRVWHYHFNKGLCDTPNDFGHMGGIPSHPVLLDWLACEIRDRNGSLKHLHRLICNSVTYQQSSAFRSDLIKRDPDNRLLARWSRQRLDADSFRDSVMLVSGQLDLTMGGPGVGHFVTSPGPQLTPVLHYEKFDLDSTGANRRSIYRVVWRGIPDPLMEALDFPDLGLLSPTRGFSASPLQSLELLNNRFVLHHIQHMTKNIKEKMPGLPAQVKLAVQRSWLREPTPDELQKLTKLADKHGLQAVCRVLLNSNEFLFIE